MEILEGKRYIIKIWDSWNISKEVGPFYDKAITVDLAVAFLENHNNDITKLSIYSENIIIKRSKRAIQTLKK